ITDLSSDPRLAGRPTRVRVASVNPAAELEMELNCQHPGHRHALQVQVHNLVVTNLVDASVQNAFSVQPSTRANVAGEGWWEQGQLRLNMQIETRPLAISFTGQQ